MLNMAIDFKALNERLYGSFEYYRKSGRDLFSPYPTDPTAGTGGVFLSQNNGNSKGAGIDIQINSINIDKKIKWTTELIFNYYKDWKTIPERTNVTYNSKLGTSASMFGYPYNSYFALRFAGLNDTTGDPQGYLNGQISKDYATLIGSNVKFSDLVYIGSRIPFFHGSLGNTISWKGLSMTFRIMYEFSYYFNRPTISYNDLFANGKGHSDFRHRWQKPGDASWTQIPSMIYPNNQNRDIFYSYSDAVATKGDHIRLQYVKLSYILPALITRKLSMDNASLYAVINDIGIVWKANKYGLDPNYLNGSPASTFTIGFKSSF